MMSLMFRSNISDSLQKFFANQIEKDMIYDILAGERGPSCKKMGQIPQLKVFKYHEV